MHTEDLSNREVDSALQSRLGWLALVAECGSKRREPHLGRCGLRGEFEPVWRSDGFGQAVDSSRH